MSNARLGKGPQEPPPVSQSPSSPGNTPFSQLVQHIPEENAARKPDAAERSAQAAAGSGCGVGGCETLTFPSGGTSWDPLKPMGTLPWILRGQEFLSPAWFSDLWGAQGGSQTTQEQVPALWEPTQSCSTRSAPRPVFPSLYLPWAGTGSGGRKGGAGLYPWGSAAGEPV